MGGLVQRAGVAFGAALILGIVDWIAVARGDRRLEYAVKPATLVAVIIGGWLLTRGPHDAWQAWLFLAGLVLSLAGDVFLMLPGDRTFLPGLVSFLLAHVCYVVGLDRTLPPWPALSLLLPIALVGGTIYRRIAAGLRRRGRERLLVPVAVYSVVLCLTLFAAWATLFRLEWTSTRRALVIGGATLFFASDALNAWERFVRPSARGRVVVMITYHLGQIGLAASMALV